MDNPFEIPKQKDIYLKVMLFGESGVGKTTLALQHPSVVLLDLEGGAKQYAGKFDFQTKITTDLKEINASVDWLLHNKHEFKTLVVDPITIYWDLLQAKWSEILLAGQPKDSAGVKGKGELQFYDFQPKDWMLIKNDYKVFMRKLLDLDMNVIITAHGKVLYKDTGFMQKAGTTFDAEKKTAYLFDVVLELFIDGKRRMASARKDRTGKLPTEPFEISYQALEGYFGKAALEREAQPVRLVTLAESDAFIELYASKGIPATRIEEKLKGEGVTTLQELPFSTLESWTKKLKEIKNK